MGTLEILTLQFGHYSNFIGTHWWNIQELGFDYSANTVCEINHDVLFREGLSPKRQVTFTPRMLLADLKGSLKSLPEEGDLYEPPSDPTTVVPAWYDQLVDVQKEQTAGKNKFLKSVENVEAGSSVNNSCNIEKDVEVWSDYLYTKFHPKTVNIVRDYQHKSIQTPFDAYPVGTNLWKSEQFDDDFCNRIRNYVEECDSFQGFHILLDAVNAFSGLSTSCIEYLRDEYDRKSVFAFPVIPPYYEDYMFQTKEEQFQSALNDSVRVLNIAFCFDALREHASLFVPLSTGANGWRQPGPKREFYHTKYDHTSPYHTSALLASALDTFTLKYRLKGTNYTLTDLKADLTSNGRKAVCASLCLPFSLNKDADLIDCLDSWEGSLSKSITPNCTLGTDYVMQLFSLRGVEENRLKRPLALAGKQKDMLAYKCESIKEMLNLYLSCTHHASVSDVTVVHKPMSVKMPYPKIFDKYVGRNGNIQADKRVDGIDVESVPVLAGLHTGSGIGNMLESLHTETRRIKFKKFHQFLQGGLEFDDFNECLDNLFELRECYEDNYVL